MLWQSLSLSQCQACFILGGCLNSVYPDLRTAQANCVWPLCLDSTARSPRVTLWGAERPMAQWSPFPRLQSRPDVPSGSFRNSSLGRRPSSQGNAVHLRNSRCPSVRWFGREFESFSPTAFHHPVPHCIYYLWPFPSMIRGAGPGSGLPSCGEGWGATDGRLWPWRQLSWGCDEVMAVWANERTGREYVWNCSLTDCVVWDWENEPSINRITCITPGLYRHVLLSQAQKDFRAKSGPVHPCCGRCALWPLQSCEMHFITKSQWKHSFSWVFI